MSVQGQCHSICERPGWSAVLCLLNYCVTSLLRCPVIRLTHVLGIAWEKLLCCMCSHLYGLMSCDVWQSGDAVVYVQCFIYEFRVVRCLHTSVVMCVVQLQFFDVSVYSAVFCWFALPSYVLSLSCIVRGFTYSMLGSETSSHWTLSDWTTSNWTTSDWTSNDWTSSNWTLSDWKSSNEISSKLMSNDEMMNKCALNGTSTVPTLLTRLFWIV